MKRRGEGGTEMLLREHKHEELSLALLGTVRGYFPDPPPCIN